MATNSNAGRQGTVKTSGGNAGKTASTVRAGSTARTVNAGGTTKAGNTGRTAGTATTARTAGAANAIRTGSTGRAGITTNTGRTVNSGKTVNAGRTSNAGSAAKTGAMVSTGKTGGTVQAGSAAKAGDTGRNGKKPHKRLKKSVCRTLGALFLASALVVAAIPVDGLQAAKEGSARAGGAPDPNKNSASVQTDSTKIPQIQNDTKIYTSGDKILQFAYLSNGMQSVAVISGYDKDSYVEGKELEIPDTVDAYKQYKDNQGGLANFVAVGKNGNFLFYRERVEKTYKKGEAPNAVSAPGFPRLVREYADGDDAYVVLLEEDGPYLTCELDTKSNPGGWGTIPDEQLYYDTTQPAGNDRSADTSADSKNFLRTSDATYQRLSGVTVAYISDQYYDSNAKEWKKVTSADPTKGVFAGTSNVVKLKMGKQFRGVGDYAFYGAGLTSIELENGLNTIGKGAFQDCIRLQTVSLDLDCPLSELGVSAFQGCTELTGFSMPWSVTKIGDYAFEGCTKLREVDLCSEGKNAEGTGSNLLEKVGLDVFKNCELLPSVTFPKHCAGPLYISSFEGCTSLKYITSRSTSLTFKEDGTYFTFDDFKDMLGEDNKKVNGEFYFEGLDGSTLHDLAKNNCFAFSYLTTDDQGNYIKDDRYEITLPDVDGISDARNTFVVTSKNNLCKYTPEGNTGTIIVPTKIGPHVIKSFDPEVFAGRQNLKTVVIPNTVSAIGDRAFQECRSLEDVIFDDFGSGSNVTVGTGAFKTSTTSGPGLHITGPISDGFGPYKYAMDEANYFTAGNQQKRYITYYSGWPQNLEVRYNEDTGMSELVNFPAVSELSSDKYNVKNYQYLKVPGRDDKYDEAISNAFEKYKSAGYNLSSMTPDERKIINAALNVEIPEGVQSIAEGLIKEKEDADAKANPLRVIEKTITAQSLKAIESPTLKEDGTIDSDHPGTFAGCENLTGVTLNSVKYGDGTVDGITDVGDYAFMNCKGLTKVDLPATVKEMGVAPFYGCEKLSLVNFQNNPDFVCEKAIIYGPAEDGTDKGKLIECLAGRSGYVESPELAGVTELAQEAFRGSNVSEVDLSETKIPIVRTGTFSETKSLNKIILPYTLRQIEDYVAVGSTVNYIAVKAIGNIRSGSYAFDGLVDNNGNQRILSDVAWRCPAGTIAEEIGESWNFDVQELEVEKFYKAIFTYWDNEQKKDVQVDGQEQYSSINDVKFPAAVGSEVEKNGEKMLLSEWKQSLSDNVWFFVAEYKRPQWKVTFVDPKGSFDPVEIWVENGGNALNSPKVPAAEGITGWKCNDGDLTSVTKDLQATADYGASHTLSIVGGSMEDGSTEGGFDVGTKITITADTPAEGQRFDSWASLPDLSATAILNKTRSTTVIVMPDEDITIVASFKGIDSGGNAPNMDGSYSLTVRGGSGSGYYRAGDQIIITADRPAEGKSFSEWSFVPDKTAVLDKTKAETVLTMPESNVTIIANYTDNGTSNSTSGNPTPSPAPEDPTPSPATDTRYYALNVFNGYNSGIYLPGQQIIVVAYDPPAGQEFSSWTVSPANTEVTDKNLSAIAVTMPEHDVALIANYKAIPMSSGNTPAPGSSSTPAPGDNYPANTNRPTGGNNNTGGTTVVIDKNGLSNTGVVNVVINGSSDNFVLKIAENSSATESVLRALLAEYGSLDNIKYFPMDITLYDSTGSRRITDTTGLKIDITLPLPDSLKIYAGNNKVAGVVNDRLDKLSPKFTTINGVPCVTFSAEHFSPYVIYVDTSRLGEGTGADDTPKTGDPIHPKWFLSIGLACLSFVMFMQKDTKKKKVAVKAR